MFVYLLQSVSGKTYIGATVDLQRRLRQHNGEITGGAKATRGLLWKRIAFVSGFPTWKDTLQFEWKWKWLSRKQKGNSVTKRKRALVQLLQSNQSTRSSTSFESWNGPIMIHWNRPIELYQ